MPTIVCFERDLTEGERWTRRELETLRGDGFSPSAIARFLAAASSRAREVRRARPDLASQAHRWAAVGGGAWSLAAALGIEPFRRRARTGLAWWGATSLMLDWHLGMVETEDGRPRMLARADGLTLARAWLVPIAADSPTPLVLGLGAATDVLDGHLARRGEPTRAGRDLEGLVDACCSLAALAGLARQGRLGNGAATAEALRLVIGSGLTFHVYFAEARPPDPVLARAARSIAVLRFAGVLAAASGRKSLGGSLVAAGAAASVALSLRAVPTA